MAAARRHHDGRAAAVSSRPGSGPRCRRSTDFYDEGWLIWLDVDTAIRELTHGAKSIEDFCHLFHGGESSAPMVKPCTIDDVVAALNQVAPHDWKAFLGSRIYQVTPHARRSTGSPGAGGASSTPTRRTNSSKPATAIAWRRCIPSDSAYARRCGE